MRALMSGFIFLLLLSALGFVTACSCDDDDDDGGGDDAGPTDDDTTGDDTDDDTTGDDTTDDDVDEPPTVVSVSPANGAVEIPLLTTIVVTFSKPMDTTSVEENFNLGSLSGTFTWNTDQDELTFTPDDALDEGDAYTVFIGAGAADQNDLTLAEAFSASFQTVDLWTMTFNSDNDEADTGNGIALDGDGNIYLAGTFSVAGHDKDIWIHAMDTFGTELWTRTVNGPASDTDDGNDIFVDADKNVYAVGEVTPSVGEFDVWVRKYDAFTTEEWTKTYGDVTLGYDYGNGVAVDSDGNVIVCGRVDFGGSDWDILIRKYDSAGDIQWMRAYDGGLNEMDNCQDVATDTDGNIFAAGLTRDVNGEDSNIWVRKLDGDGTPQWTKTHNGSADMADVANGIAVDGDGYVYVVGSEWISGQYANIWVRKYDSTGDEVWTATVDGDDHLADQAKDVAVDALGNVYVAGNVQSSDDYDDIWVGKFDSDGNELWSDIFQGADQGTDVGNGIALDGDANVYVVGVTYTDDADRNIWVRKYDTNGVTAE